MKSKSHASASDYRKLSDEELAHRYAHRNEPAAFTHLFDRYNHLVFGVCLNLLKDTEAAKDATQQVFIKLLDDLRRFEIAHFKPWLFRVTRNYCFMQLRKPLNIAGNRTVDEEADRFDMEFEEETHLKVEEEKIYNNLEEALKTLSEEQRACIGLFYVEKLTYSEISNKTGYTLMQVKSHIQNGRRNLKIKMEAFRNVQ